MSFTPITFNIVNLSERSKNIYLKIYNRSNQSTNFHMFSFLEIIQVTRDDLELKFYVLYEKSEIIAIMPFFQKKYLPFTLSSLPYGCYGGFLYETRYRDKVFSFLGKYRYRLFTIINVYHDDVYANKYLHATTCTTWVVQCTNHYDDFFTKLHPKTRNQIRKARKSGIEIKNIETKEELTQVYEIYKGLVLKHNIKKPYPKKLFVELFTRSLDSEDILFKLSVLEDKITAYSVFLNNDRTIFYWLNASCSEFVQFNGTNAILDDMVRYAYHHNIQEINLGAVPYGNQGLHHFKNRWRADEVCYHSYTSKIYQIRKVIIDTFFS